MDNALCLYLGSIPARAGETASGLARRNISKVYPRTGGGNPSDHYET